jgi:hypothetical protein
MRSPQANDNTSSPPVAPAIVERFAVTQETAPIRIEMPERLLCFALLCFAVTEHLRCPTVNCCK